MIDFDEKTSLPHNLRNPAISSGGGKLTFVSWIQFIGVILVVFGHSMNGIKVSPIITHLQAWIYTFHMPLFFMVSAYLFSYHGGYAHKGGYKNTLKAKFNRLLLPYIIWNAAFVFPKFLFADYITDHVELSLSYFLRLTIYPRENILGHTWFLFTLFTFFVLAFAFDKLLSKRQTWLPIMAILAVMNCFGLKEQLLSISDLMQNAVFFWIGLILGTYKIEHIYIWGKDHILFWLVILIVIAGFVTWIFFPLMRINTLTFSISIIILLGMLQIRYNITNDIIDFISKNTFAIFILHWPVMMVIRLVLYQMMHCSSEMTMSIMFLGGIGTSAAIAWFFRWHKCTFTKGFARIILGM